MSETDNLLRGAYLQVIEREPKTRIQQFIYDTCQRHQTYTLTYLHRVLAGDSSPRPQRDVKAVLIKAVNDSCNLACRNCYEGPVGFRSGGGKMSEAQLEIIIRDLLAVPRRDIQFLWHGGEPLLAGIPFYQTAVRFQRRFNPHDCVIWNGLQTNGLLLDDRWIDFIKQEGFGVSISLDGPARFHNRYRVTKRGGGSFEQVAAKMALLRSADIEFNVITVVDDELATAPDEYYDLVTELGLKNIDIHPACNIGVPGGSHVDPGKYAAFACRIFECWLDRNDGTMRISVVEEFFRALVGNPVKTCYHAGVCSDIFAVEGNGSVIPCTRPFDRTIHTFGNVHQQPIAEIINGGRLKAFRAADNAAQHQARACRWFGICHNGCPQHRTVNGKQDISGASVFCTCVSGNPGGNFAIWQHMFDRVSGAFREA